MIPAPETANGVITLPSNSSVPETLDRLEALLHEKNVKIFIRIDQSAEAAAVGLTLPPTQFLLFGNPKGGTPVMQAAPLAALDLPLRAIAWQDINGKVWLSYNNPQTLATRFGLAADLLAPLHAASLLIQQSISQDPKHQI